MIENNGQIFFSTFHAVRFSAAALPLYRDTLCL